MDSISNHLAVSYARGYAPYIPATTPHRASTDNNTTTAAMPSTEGTRRASNPSNTHTASLHPVRTRSVGGFLSAGVIFERDPTSPPTDEDIIIVTVRISRKERRNSFDEPLPDRPPARGFFRRMSTRVLTQGSPDKYKAVKMPRGEYARFFKHDAQGNYVGTEPEREWGEEEIMAKYGQYQHLSLQTKT